MKESVVEWFHKQVVKEITSHGFISMTMLDKLKEQAQELFEEQITDAYCSGFREGEGSELIELDIDVCDTAYPIDYYTTTYQHDNPSVDNVEGGVDK